MQNIIILLILLTLIFVFYWQDNTAEYFSANTYSFMPIMGSIDSGQFVQSKIRNQPNIGRDWQIHWSPVISVGKHVRFDKYQEIDDITSFPPKPESGEKKCYKFECPEDIMEGAICWQCK